jgi:hypothetical protein
MGGCGAIPSWDVARCCPFCHRRGDLGALPLVRRGVVRVCCVAARWARRERPDLVDERRRAR